MKSFEEKLSDVLNFLMVVMLFIISVFVMVQMIVRAFRLPIFVGWMQELSLFLLVIMSFVGGVLAFRKYAHIRITLLMDLCKNKQKIRTALTYFSKTASLAYSVIFVVMSIMYCQHLLRVGTRTMTMPMGMNFKLAYVYIPLVFCFLLNIFYIAYHFKTVDFTSPHSDETPDLDLTLDGDESKEERNG